MPPRFSRIGLLAVCAACCAFANPQPATSKQPHQSPRTSTGSPSAGNPIAGSPAAGEARAGTLVVFPFENDGRIANLDWLGEGLAELTVERFEDRGLKVL